jgi:hypothetical protein
MHPTMGQALIEARITERLHQAAAARLARQARATAHIPASRTARTHAPTNHGPVEAIVPAARPAHTARHSRPTSADHAAVNTAARGHGATAVEVAEAPEMCGSAR